jgi:hypothetical protein
LTRFVDGKFTKHAGPKTAVELEQFILRNIGTKQNLTKPPHKPEYAMEFLGVAWYHVHLAGLAIAFTLGMFIGVTFRRNNTTTSKHVDNNKKAD